MRVFKVLVLLMFVTVSACAQSNSGTYNTNKNGVLIDGYDVVAYQGNKVIKGNTQYSYDYVGVILYFSSVENLNKFKSSPEKYMPAYGGWCAYAVGETKEKVDINPNTYKIIDGKVYLFYNKNFTNTLKLWNKDEARLKKLADQNWPQIK